MDAGEVSQLHEEARPVLISKQFLLGPLVPHAGRLDLIRLKIERDKV